MRVGDEDVTTDIVTDFSSIHQAIVHYASNKNADLVFIGTTGKTGLKRFLIGRVAESVVRHAHSPVLVVRWTVTCYFRKFRLYYTWDAYAPSIVRVTNRI
jgi:nucleotide-binding universal stress UspA family protein